MYCDNARKVRLAIT